MIKKPSERQIAFHEAGHVVAFYLGNIPFDSATIIPEDEDVGPNGPFLIAGKIIPTANLTYAKSYKKAIIAFMGPVAEARYRHCSYPQCFEQYKDGDVKVAIDAIHALCIDEPMLFPSEIELQEKLVKMAIKIVRKHWAWICLIAEKLIERKGLTRDEIINSIKPLDKEEDTI